MSRQPKPWRRGGGPWYSQVAGEKVWLAPKDASKTQAQEELYRVLAEKGIGVGPKKAGGKTTVSSILNLYFAHIEEATVRGERTRGSLSVYEMYLQSALRHFGALAVGSLEPKHVLDWLKAPKPRGSWNTSTRSHATKVLKAAFHWARKAGHIKVDPLAELDRSQQKRREIVPTPAQALAIADAFPDQEFKDLLFALRETGCRPSEVFTLTADRVDLNGDTWRVRNKTRGKTGESERTIYLTAAMVALSRRLVALHPEGPIFRNTEGNPWNRFSVGHRLWRLQHRKPGVGKEANAYALRHLFATQALVNNVPVATVATLLGHTSTDMVMTHYSKLAREKEHLREAAEQARGGSAASLPPG